MHNLQSPEYKLLTDDEVAIEQERYFRRAKWELKMPPIMNPREEINKIVREDPEIADAVTYKMGFIDISHRVKNRVGILMTAVRTLKIGMQNFFYAIQYRDQTWFSMH